MKRFAQPWSIYLAVGALGTLVYVALPPFVGSGPFLNLLGLSAILAVVAGILWHRPVARLPWWLFVVGLGLFWLGDLYTYSYPKLLHHEVPFPSIGDAIYLTVYPALMAGLVLLVRRRNPQRKARGGIDATILTLGLALPSWTLLIAPYLHDDALSVVPKVVSVAYPLGDILLLAAAVSLAMDTGRRQGSFYLLSASIVSLLVTDFAYGLMLLHGTYDHQLSLDVGWIAFYLFWGAAALHPSMRALDQPSPDREAKLTTMRLALLAGACLIAPATELIDAARNGDTDLIVVIGASVLLFSFVVARMAGLVRQQERTVARERVLSAAGGALVAATGRDEITRAALDSVGPLLEGPGIALLCRRDDQGLTVADHGIGSGAPVSATTASELIELCAVADSRGGAPLSANARTELRLPADHDRAIALSLRIRGEVRGLLLIARPVSTPEPVERSLRSLATQLALALESAALTEEVHERRSEARFASLVQNASDLITVLGPDGNVTYQSPSSEAVLGYTPEELVGTAFDRLLVPGEEGRLLSLLSDGAAGEGELLECSLRHRDGTPRQFEILYTNLSEDERVQGIVLNARDVSERRRFEAQLAHQAFHDPVTGLPNRALFVDRVTHRLARSRRDATGLAVIFLDLDDFKTINDSLGHAAGDKVLVEVAQRLAATVRTSDTAARFGGDEFALLLEDVDTLDEAADTAERIMAAVAQPFTLAGKELSVHCSMGISIPSGDTATDAEELIRDADAAMYIAKRDGKNGYRLFEPEMHDGVMARLELRADLQRALTAGEFELFYQPVVRLADTSVVGVEALLRWRHPERGLVSPNDFIPFAEESGLIVPMGRWVVREACRQAMVMQQASGPDPLSMSVNLSVKQLQHSDIVADVGEALAESGLAPEQLTLEITESVLMNDSDLAIERLEELRALGVRLAMDDFGTGYSSLSYLSRFPVDVLKMDRSFLGGATSAEVSDLASAVIAIGERMHLDVVAEGIELVEQWATLNDLGCGHGQGFLFARPMPAAETLEALRNWVERTPDSGRTRRRSPPPMQHSYEGLDRSGGISRVRSIAPLRYRDFRLLWSGMCISLLGDGAFLVAMAWQVYALSNAPTALALVGIAMSVPTIALLLVGGVVSDRFDRRNIMIAADIGRGLVVSVLAVLALSGSIELWHLVIGVALYGAFQAFFDPAFDAIVPDVLPAAELAQANALDQVVRPLALRLAGPALGGVIIDVGGAGAVFALDAVSFAISAGALLAMIGPVRRRSKRERRVSVIGDMKEGFAYVRSHVWLWGTFVVAAVSYLLFLGPTEVLLPYIVKEELGASGTELGLVFGAGGLASVACALAMGQTGLPRRNITFMYVAWTVATVAVAGYGVATAVWQLMIASMIFNALETVGTIVWATTKQRHVPASLLGRVSSLDWLISIGLLPLSFALTAPITAAIGVQATLIGAGLIGGVVTLAGLFLPGMRDLERTELRPRPALSGAVARQPL